MGTAIEFEARLPGPTSEVFEFLAHCENEVAWNPDVVDIKRVDDGDVHVGSEWDGNYKGIGAQRIRVTDYERDKRLGFVSSGPRMDMTFAFTFTPAGDETDVRGGGELQPKGAMRLMAPFAGPMIRRGMAKRPAQLIAGFNDWRQDRARA